MPLRTILPVLSSHTSLGFSDAVIFTSRLVSYPFPSPNHVCCFPLLISLLPSLLPPLPPSLPISIVYQLCPRPCTGLWGYNSDKNRHSLYPLYLCSSDTHSLTSSSETSPSPRSTKPIPTFGLHINPAKCMLLLLPSHIIAGPCLLLQTSQHCARALSVLAH